MQPYRRGLEGSDEDHVSWVRGAMARLELRDEYALAAASDRLAG